MKFGYSFDGLVNYVETIDKTTVKLTGNQDIGGSKTFLSNIIMSAAQGVAGNNLARRDFVEGQDRLYSGQYEGWRSVSASSNLTLSDLGKLVIMNTPNLTLRFPKVGAVRAGGSFRVKNASQGVITMYAEAGDLFEIGAVTARDTYVINAGCEVEFIGSGTNLWSVVGMGMIKDIPGFAGIFTQNGWQKLPSGLLIQWGTGPATRDSCQITFPIAFPNAVLWVSEQDSRGGTIATIWQLNNVSNSGMSGENIGSLTRGHLNLEPPTLASPWWFAIGW